MWNGSHIELRTWNQLTLYNSVGIKDKTPTHSQYYRPEIEKKKTALAQNYTIEIKYPSHTKLTWFKQTRLAKMTAIGRNNKQNQFYRKQARLSLNEGIQILRVRDKNQSRKGITDWCYHPVSYSCEDHTIAASLDIIVVIIGLIIKITISSIVIGLHNSYFSLIHLPSCYRTVCYRTVQ